MQELVGPVGFQHIESAPKNGQYLRLRFRRVEGEVLGRWKPDAAFKSGGFWVDADGCYISPGPLFWAQSSKLVM